MLKDSGSLSWHCNAGLAIRIVILSLGRELSKRFCYLNKLIM